MNINKLKALVKTAGIAGNISSYYTNLDPAKTNFFRTEEDLNQAARFTDASANTASLATLLGIEAKYLKNNKQAIKDSGGLINLVLNPIARKNAEPIMRNLNKGFKRSLLGAAIAYPLAGILAHNLYRNAQKNRESIESKTLQS